MTPLPDRTVVLGLLTTLGLVFALVFWFVRLSPPSEPPLQWRDTPQQRPPAGLPRSGGSTAPLI
ncbi:MAG: hypothetical protein RLZZ219_1152 [Cyanobacteriota bacterium]|jgi:hypothetical protein